MANCAAWSHRWRPHPNHVSPKGVPHTTVTRTNVLNNPGQSTLEVARSAQVCEQSVRRYQQRMADTGSVAPKAHTGGAAKKLTRADAYALYLMTMAKPSITRDEMQAFLVLNRAKLVSVWTISREWQRLGLTRKRMKFYSMHRDEASRVAFWTNANTPALPRNRRGVAGTSAMDIINIDECIMYIDRKNRLTGHSPAGERAAEPGVVRSDGDRYQCVAAVSCREGVIAAWVYMGGMDHHLFNLFVNEVCRRAAAAAPGVRRTVLVDNAAWHVPAELRPICQHWGCDLLQQPVHSPDFAPVEHCHSNVEQTLRRDARDITRYNFRDRVEAAYNAIGPAKARAFFSNAYYCVPGLPFTPYMGQQTT